MNIEKENIVNCSQFEELLTDYLDKTLDSRFTTLPSLHMRLAARFCHSLLNDVKDSLEACHNLAAPGVCR